MANEAPVAMPIPMGVFDTGGFSDALDPAALAQVVQDGSTGSVPSGVIAAKGTSDAAHFGMLGGELNAQDLASTGWAVMFGPSVSKQIRTNLSPLAAPM